MGDISQIYGGAIDIDADNAATGDDFAILPAGWYPVTIDAAEVKPTKAGTGKYLKMELTVIGDTFSGRRLFTQIMLDHPNAKCVEIGMRQFSALGLACGLDVVNDSDEFLGKTVQARVKVGKARDGYDAQNEISAYKVIGAETTPPATTSTAAAPAPAAPAETQKPIWQR